LKWEDRKYGEETAYISVGPFVHYRFEWPDYIQGLLMCAVGLFFSKNFLPGSICSGCYREFNDSDYGLQAGIFTNDINTACSTSKQLEVGGVLINDIPTFRVDQMPYGGVKESGSGKEGLTYAIEEMTEMKLVIWNSNN